MNTNLNAGYGKRLLVVLVFLLTITTILYLKTDYLQQATEYVNKTLLGKSDTNSMVTFYQWTNEQGETVISQDKPVQPREYIVFQALPDLIKNENIIDQTLIERSNQYQSQRQSNQQNAVKSQQSGKAKTNIQSTVSGTIFEAPTKAKNCVNVAVQHAANNRKAADSGSRTINTDPGC
ncbi:hypothetical protein FLL45_15705 [Aliikangiella marina]|uniref:DUF4124 domain-containing protein n=1 Tax=Aliikangiella marina TaxID=1712262 RepID=A0A545T6Q6_9GAMM|nr:hypothetical protein [Aliikangiella marina]TQV72909.1 hypothetical protein FLL45_15705 [Aliikangiella marina]